MLQLNFHPFPELTTERLLLRKLSPSDIPEIFFMRSDEGVMKYIPREPATTIKEAEDFIIKINENIDNNIAILWGISLKEDPTKLIGTICLWQIRNEAYRAEAGYLIHPGHWRKGFAKEALRQVMDYGFNSMKLHSIDAHVDPDNKGSIAVLESLGFVREGYLREAVFFRDKFLDEAIYSKLKG